MIQVIVDISSVYWPEQFGVCYHRKSEGMFCTKNPAMSIQHVKLWDIKGLKTGTTSWPFYIDNHITRWQFWAKNLRYFYDFYEMAILSSIWIKFLSNDYGHGSSALIIELFCERKFTIHYNSKARQIDWHLQFYSNNFEHVSSRSKS